MSWLVHHAVGVAQALRRRPPALAWAVAFVTLGVAASWWPPDLIAAVDVARADQPASWAHPLGTDHLGRDVLQRLLAAPAAPLAAGIGCVALSSGVGIALGLCLGAAGGVAGAALRGAAGLVRTALAAIPDLVLAVLVASVLDGDLGTVAATLGVAFAVPLGDAIGARLRDLRATGYLDALRRHGVGWPALVGRHLLVASCGRLIVRHALTAFAAWLVAEATLSYLGGFGTAEPAASWGNMIAFSWGRLDGNPWAWLAPAAALWGTLWALHGLAAEVGDA